MPLKAKGYRFKANFPEAALLAKEADVRLAGVNIGKVKSTELGPGGQTTRAEMEIDSRFAPIKVDTRAILRQKSLLGETFVELAPGQPDAKALPDGGTLARTNVDDTVQLDEVFRTFDPRTRRYFQEWLHDSGIATTGQLRLRPERRAGQRRAVLRAAARPAAAAGRPGGGAAPDRARHRADVPRDLARERAAARPGHERRGHLLRAGLARRRAGGDLPDPADVPARDARDGHAAAALRRQHRPAGARPAPAGRATWDRRSATSATCRRTSSTCSTRSTAGGRLGDRRTGRPALPRGAEPLLASTHDFLSELNPILSYLSYSRQRCRSSCHRPAPAPGRDTGRAAIKRTGPGEHYLPQVAIIDSRSLQQRTTRPPWERGQLLHRAERLPARDPARRDRELRLQPRRRRAADPSGVGGNAAPPCFVAPKQLFQDQKYPRLQRGHAPVVAAPTGTQGNSPARP